MTNTQNTIGISLNHMRLSGPDKNYWLKQLQIFADRLDAREIKAVQYGKQDTRGCYSITLVDHRDCVPRQKHFRSSLELLAYVDGFNAAMFGGALGTYIKGE